MANKTFHKRLFLYLIGMATHSVGGVRGFCLFYLFKLSTAYCASSGVNFSPASDVNWS